MYLRSPSLAVGTAYIPPLTTMNYVTLSESQRVLAQQSPSTFIRNQEVTILPGGYDTPVMVVGNTPASLTTIQRQTASLYAGNDPYNPATRFTQYFPKLPPGIPCIPTQPNNSPQAPIVPCNAGTGRFRGSVVQ